MTVKMKRLLKSHSGFSLVEMLASLLVITLLFTVVATGVPVAQRVYNQVVAGSNAQLLLSTSAMRLREELGLGRMADPDATGTVSTYISGTTGMSTTLTPNAGKTGIQIVAEGYPGNPTELVTEGDVPDRLYVTFDHIDYSKGIFTVKNLSVKQKKNTDAFSAEDAVLAEVESLNIRSLPTS